MANVVQCTGCGTKLKAPENSAGKKIRCPKCQAIIAIPAESVPAPSPSAGFVPAPTGPGQRPASPSSYPDASSGPVPAPTFAPAPVPAPTVASAAPAVAPSAPRAPMPAPVAVAAPEQWRVRMVLEGTLQTFGPVTKSELDQWFQESRLDAETELERNASGQWIGAANVYPSLAPAPATSPARPEPVATPAPAPSPPRIGLPQVAPAAPAKKTNGFLNIQTGAPGAASVARSAAPVAAGGVATGIDPTSVSNIPGRKKGKPMAMGGQPMGGGVSTRSKLVAGLLGIFLGAWGVHRFYLGYMGMGAIQIAVTICTCGLGGIWGLIEGIMILLGSFDEDADGRKLAD